jgi:hypothetical protein
MEREGESERPELVTTHHEVELLPAVGRVDGHVLDAEEVLAGGDLLGQLEGEGGLADGEPAVVLAVPRHLGAELVHLEPVARAVVA